MSTTLDLINAIENGKTRESESIFKELLQPRIDDAVEYRRMELAQSMFKTQEPA